MRQRVANKVLYAACAGKRVRGNTLNRAARRKGADLRAVRFCIYLNKLQAQYVS